MKQKPTILITAGPTRERIDPVRYLSSDSSGRMGFALAAAAQTFGFHVVLIAGPVGLEAPKGVERIDVITASEMHRAVMKRFRDADVIVMAAAVSDWRPARARKQKMKRALVRSGTRTLVLEENPDILAELGKKKSPHQTLVGFALETKDLEKNARKKLKRKKCDWIVANTADAIGAKNSKTLLIPARGKKIPLPRLPKTDLAFLLLSYLFEKKSV